MKNPKPSNDEPQQSCFSKCFVCILRAMGYYDGIGEEQLLPKREVKILKNPNLSIIKAQREQSQKKSQYDHNLTFGPENEKESPIYKYDPNLTFDPNNTSINQ